MTHLDFLTRIVDGASAIVPPFDQAVPLSPQERNSVAELYRGIDLGRRLDAPRAAPQLDQDAAIWGGLVLHHCCWAILDRGQSAIELPPMLADDMPSHDSADAQWSVDLMLSVWPDVDRRCRQVSEKDPLKETLHDIACAFPLSAIGLKLKDDVIQERVAETTAWKTIVGHPCLSRLARDRAEKLADAAFQSLIERTPTA